MKRFALLTIVVIVIASTTGCRRGLRLWGTRGAPCTPSLSPTPGGGLPGAYAPGAQNPYAGAAAAAMPVCPCPVVEQPAPIDCGCAAPQGSYDPAYGGFGSVEGPPAGPGETIVGDRMIQGATIPGYPPAEMAPVIPSFSPQP